MYRLNIPNCITLNNTPFCAAVILFLMANISQASSVWADNETPSNGPIKSNIALEEITLFTHGDTPLLLPATDGSLYGPALDLFRCSMESLGRPFFVTKAPLSRARQIISKLNNAIWFPSAYRGSARRMARSVGPAGTLDVYWYKNKDNPLDPNSSAFKRSATVTTYKGSAMATQLREEGYHFIEGSADRNRLVSMLLSGQVDAFAAIDFRDRLSSETLKKLSARSQISIKNIIPAAFRVSDMLFENEPDFTSKFRAAFDTCRGHGNQSPSP